MDLVKTAIQHILETAKIPSFSSYEERVHPYIRQVFARIPGVEEISVPGNSLIYQIKNPDAEHTLALAAHLDKINHYGKDFPEALPVRNTAEFIEGAMDDSAGVGIILALAGECSDIISWPNLLFFFSEMEESKGLKEHPELLKNRGEGYAHGMGAKQIARTCLQRRLIPDQVITIDTTPLFRGDGGVALYAKPWEYTELKPTEKLITKTTATIERFKNIDPDLFLANNTNDYLHYGYEFNRGHNHTVVSLALEPAIYPYHQQGERVWKGDIRRVLTILMEYICQEPL